MSFPIYNDIDELVAAINSRPQYLGDQRRLRGGDNNGEQDPILEFLHAQDPESQTPRLVSLPTAAELASVDLSLHCEYLYDFTSSMEPTHGMQSHFPLESMGALPSAESHPTYNSSRVPSTDTNSFTQEHSAHFELLRDLSYPHENVPKGTMFMYPNDGTEGWTPWRERWDISDMKGDFDAAVQLRKTEQTWDLEDQAWSNFFKDLRSKTKHMSKKNWKPVSIYQALGMLKRDDTRLPDDYVPYTNCTGIFNFRPPGAWKRGPKRTKEIKKIKKTKEQSTG